MKVSKETKRWNDYPQIEDDAKDLGSAAKETLNLIANGTFIVGFNTSYLGYGDGLPLFSTAHTSPSGGSNQSNASSTGITLTEGNLETGVTALRQQKTGTGKKLMVGPGNLVLMVPEALDKEAVIITGSQKRSGTTDNDLNWYQGKFAVLINPFIGSDITDLAGNAGSNTAWFLFARGVNGLTFIYDQRPIYYSWEDKDKDSFYTKVYFSCKATWKNWIGTYGSKGDGVAYSS